MRPKRLRSAARAIVLDDEERILLVRLGEGERAVWLTTGGGVEPGESDEAALRRELAEEAGLERFELGPLVWTRTVRQPLGGGRFDGQVERYYLVRAEPFEPAPRLSREELAAEGVTSVRWWTLGELAAPGTRFAPPRLPELLRDRLRHGPPATPIDVDR
ncbi:MAG: NUDIX domain-containing protein [Thermoleophilia bacterium]|nr:NUDIX domain-containing protein [Thermoleophilia bacterium]